MPKVKVTSTKGLVQEKGNGMENQVGMYSGQGTTTATVTTGDLLGEGFVHTVNSTDNAHKVKLPIARGAGQIMIIRNVDDAQDVVITANGGSTLVTLGEEKTAVFISSAAGDNWSGSQVD